MDKLGVRAVRLNAGGYSEYGRYFGRSPGSTVYECDTPDGDVWYLRASCRAVAVQKVRAKFPGFKVRG